MKKRLVNCTLRGEAKAEAALQEKEGEAQSGDGHDESGLTPGQEAKFHEQRLAALAQQRKAREDESGPQP